jgi:alpha-mannosidase
VEYDAWDLDAHYVANTTHLTHVTSITVTDEGPLVASVSVTREFGASTIHQSIILRAESARVDFVTDVSWHEHEKVLKVAFPVDVHAREIACDIQFGHVYRPAHASTSWDAAKFEVCAHRWIDVSEPGFGVALLNDCKYGYDIQRGALRLTLLRATNYPDPNADRGEHHFTYSLFAHPGSLSGVRAGAARLNQPLTVVSNAGALRNAVRVVTSSNDNVVITAVKRAEDSSGDLIIRCYEANGGRATATITTIVPWATATVCNFLEQPLALEVAAIRAIDEQGIHIELRPFQILTLRLSS